MDWQLALLLVLTGSVLFTLHDKCQYHSERFWLTKKFSYFRPNWKNRYVSDRAGGLVIDEKGKFKVKWYTWIAPWLIDGVHLFKDLMLISFFSATYVALADVLPGGYIEYIIAMYAFRQIEHWVIMHGNDK